VKGFAFSVSDIVKDSNGNFIVTDDFGKLIKATPDGTVTLIGFGFGHLGGLAISPVIQLPLTPQQAISALIKSGNSFGANTNALGNAVKLLSDSNPSNDNGACGKLGAFINQVNANHSLTVEQKAQLVSAANAIKNSIGC